MSLSKVRLGIKSTVSNSNEGGTKMSLQPELDRELLENIGNTAYNYEKEYHGCSQCVLRALQEHLGLDSEGAFKAASALAGGVARMGETCGAVSGGIMAISLAFGRERLEDATTSLGYARAMQHSSQLFNKVQAEFGSTRCWSIHESIFGRHFDLNNPDERTQFLEAGGHEKCSGVVRKVAILAAEIILLGRIEAHNNNDNSP